MSKIIHLVDNETAIIAPIFAGFEDTTVWSCIQGRNYARAMADDAEHPTCAVAMVSGVREGSCGFSFIAGDAASHAARQMVEEWLEICGGMTIVPQNAQWAALLEEYPRVAEGKHTRFATDKHRDSFDREKLALWRSRLPEGFELRRIDRETYEKCLAQPWSFDAVGNFTSFDDFASNGYQMGFAALHDGEPVSVCGSYSAYDGGVEIEIDTREDFRRRGLARACASALILECLESGLYPSWDAANSISIALAQSLGYIKKEDYIAYFCK